ncbi:MAG TPA: hypothetical protein VFZ65_03030, partial [Planctomycetota bacterium]|nr:hypothetical protein [Planctomycetota bacterium]
LARANDPSLRDAPRGDAARAALLQDALSFYDRFLVDRPSEPELRAGRCKALISISQVHFALGEATRAASVAEEAAAEAQALLAERPDDLERRSLLGESLRMQGRALLLAGNLSAARPLLVAATPHLEACASADPVTHGRSYVAVLSEAADTLYDAEPEQSLAGKRASLAALEALRAAHPEIPGLAEDHLQARVTVAVQLSNMRRWDDAHTLLADVAADLPLVTRDKNRLTTLVRRQQARVTWELGDRPKAIEYIEAAIDAAEAWQLEQPQWVQPQEMLLRSLRELGGYQNYVGAFAASSAAFRRAIAQAEVMVERFSDDPSQLAKLGRVVADFTHVLWDRFRREDLDEAEALAARAVAINDRIPSTVEVNHAPRWLLLALQAGITESLGRDASALWQVIETELPSDTSQLTFDERNKHALASVGLAQWHLLAGRHEQARAALALARTAIAQNKSLSDKLLVNIGWLDARIAIAEGDHAAAATAADAIMAARSTWFAHRRAADCLHLAWRCAAASASAPALVESYRTRAIEHYDVVMRTLRSDVAAEPKDPWYVLPWGFACVRTAELVAAGDRARALELLQDALPRLEAVRALAHVDQWEDGVAQDGRELQAKLAGDTHR